MIRIKIMDVNTIFIITTDELILKDIDNMLIGYNIKRNGSIIHAISLTIIAILKELSEEYSILIGRQEGVKNENS